MKVYELNKITKRAIGRLLNDEIENACSSILNAAYSGKFTASIQMNIHNPNINKIIESVLKRYPNIYWYIEPNNGAPHNVAYTFDWEDVDDDADLEEEEDYSNMPDLIPFK